MEKEKKPHIISSLVILKQDFDRINDTLSANMACFSNDFHDHDIDLIAVLSEN